MAKIIVQERQVTIISHNENDYISLTDIAKYKSDDPTAVIGNWMRNRNTIEFLGIWESLYNPMFKPLEFEVFRKEVGLNAFTLSPQKWTKTTNAIGIVAKSGRYGGTFAHKDIAFKFASWISVEFELYIVKEFQRLKEEEQKQLGWSAKRELSKINYRIHTDAIKRNIRDYATINELICLSNMENLNAVFIDQGLPQGERLIKLNQIAIQQMKVLEDNQSRNLLQ
ncbi:KilA-N domain-containing protein [Parabacteroides distasonis]|nr:KilA-N domain-containing protein [Parabacteroides distasonis]